MMTVFSSSYYVKEIACAILHKSTYYDLDRLSAHFAAAIQSLLLAYHVKRASGLSNSASTEDRYGGTLGTHYDLL